MASGSLHQKTSGGLTNGSVVLFIQIYLYIGHHECAIGGDVKPPDIKYLLQHLKQTSHCLKGLRLVVQDASLLLSKLFMTSKAVITFWYSFLEIYLCTSPQLRLLQFNLRLRNEKIKKSQDNVIQWFRLVCERVTSRSIIIELQGFPDESEPCKNIEDTLLALNKRTDIMTIYLCGHEVNPDEAMKAQDVRKLFSRLHETGIVVEKWIPPCLGKVGIYPSTWCPIY